MKIKICGITRIEDARTAASLGVDALGFIFAPMSQRYISPANAAEITRMLPPFVSKVGVFIDEEPNRVLEIAKIAGLDTIQLHGHESPDYCTMLRPYPVIKVFSVSPEFDVSVLLSYRAAAGCLLDTWDPERRGGTGRTFDWTAAVRACGICDTVILSGGLGPTNLEEAIETVHPYAVDLNSGVEISPGVKNPYKMKSAVEIVRKHQCN